MAYIEEQLRERQARTDSDEDEDGDWTGGSEENRADA